MGILVGLIFALAAFLFYKSPVDWYWPFLRWWKSEEEAREIQQEVKWAFVLFAGGIAVLCFGLQAIGWWTGRW